MNVRRDYMMSEEMRRGEYTNKEIVQRKESKERKEERKG